MRGRKPTPTAAKKLRGNPGKRALNKHEPQLPSVVNVDAPPWLDERANEVWCWYAPRLLKSRALTEVDLHNLEAFCMAYSRWRTAEDNIAANGITVESAMGVKKNPAVTVANEAMRQMQSFGASLGLDPASRSRIKVPGGPTANPFTAL